MSITGVKEIISDYALFYDNITCLSSLNVSGNTQLNNYTTINAPLYINTYQSTPPISALSVNCTSITNLVNIVQNAIWNESAKNYALNVTGYSNFGGIQINGQDNKHIYNPSGDLKIVSPGTDNILFKTNFGFWETMRINPYGVTVNTKLNVSSTTTLNDDVTCLSNIHVLGNGNLGGLKINGNDNLRTILKQTNGPLSIGTFDSSSILFYTNNNSEKLRINSDGIILNNACTLLSSLNISGRTIIGNDVNNFSDSVVEVYKNFTIRKNVLNVAGTGERLELNVGASNSALNTVSFLNMEEGKNITLYASIGNINLNANKVNVSNDLNVFGSVRSTNLCTQKGFTFNCNTICAIVNDVYYRYDIDLTKYTTFNTTTSGSQLRKFRFMSWLTSGAHNTGKYSLCYDIDYANAINLNPISSNGLNVIAYGFPHENYNLNTVTPNGCFIWKYDFDRITFFSNIPASFQAIIIDYLSYF
jgi:hypothetical protein